MPRHDDGPLLSAEELAFLHEVFQGPGLGAHPDGRARLPLDPNAGDALGRYLMALGPLVLESDQPGRRLRFPFSVVEDPDTGTLSLELSYPRILEVHPARDRSLRVRPAPEDEIAVVDPDGRLTTPEILDLSVSGILIADHPTGPLKVGDALPTLYVRVGGEIVTVEGHIVRSEGPADGDPSSPQRLALSLTADDEARRALQAYVFRRFRESEQHLEEDPFDGSR